MTKRERDCVWTIAKWLNEDAGPVPWQEIATVITAFRVLDARVKQEMNNEESDSANSL